MRPPFRVGRIGFREGVLRVTGPARFAAAAAAMLAFAAAVAAAGPLLLPPTLADVPLAVLAWIAVLATAAAGGLAAGALAHRAVSPAPPRGRVSRGAAWACSTKSR